MIFSTSQALPSKMTSSVVAGRERGRPRLRSEEGAGSVLAGTIKAVQSKDLPPEHELLIHLPRNFKELT